MNILTYNTSWQSTEPTKLDFGILGEECKKNVETCRENIRNIIFDKSKQYDFIGLQELTNKLLNITDEDNSIEYSKKFDEYTLISRGIIYKKDIIRGGIIYNNLKYHPIYTVHGSIYSNEYKKQIIGRIYMATLFKILNTDNIILVINVHFPHDKINNIIPFKYIQDEIKYNFNIKGIKININTPFIIIGDFNRNLNNLTPLSNFTFLDQSLIFNKNKKTCCTTDNVNRHDNLNYESDYIIYSSRFFINPIYDILDSYPASDHFALNSTIELKGNTLSKSKNIPTIQPEITPSATGGSKKTIKELQTLCKKNNIKYTKKLNNKIIPLKKETLIKKLKIIY